MALCISPQQIVPGLLLAILCLCVVHNSEVHGRTVREEPEQTDTDDEQLSDMEEDFWPVLCPENNWFSKEQDQCMECSWCPHDQYIIRPCYQFHDTKCSPLGDLTESGTPSSQLLPLTKTDVGRNGNIRSRGGRDGSKQASDLWSPAAMVLSVIVGVLLLALVVTSVAVCILWRRQQEDEPPKTAEKLVCSYSPAPSETV
ncbi:hypothetical protein ElyMa_003681600 [Elysia marginata]|uniref:TNFR-Cys domain-containing protein n=1 Tax=Elysia marginata TaxID=1093978 RepID=A0AAV4F084_9GAST|nr:hypothetical protein ElyMa_003681600 [Elysia marginata]